MKWNEIIEEKLKEDAPFFEEDIRDLIKGDKARVSGYLQCLVDLGKINMKKQGNVKIYFIKRGKT